MHIDPVFALVQDREILLFPITIDDINTRNNPTEDYYYCYYDEAIPAITNAIVESYVDVPMLAGSYVLVRKIIVRKSLEELFAMLIASETLVTIDLVPPELIEAFTILVKERTQLMLDQFAQTKGYDDIKSVTTYVNSTVTSFSTEATRAVYLRDTTWSSLYGYLNGLLTGVEPIPSSWVEIATHLPELTWEVTI